MNLAHTFRNFKVNVLKGIRRYTNVDKISGYLRENVWRIMKHLNHRLEGMTFFLKIAYSQNQSYQNVVEFFATNLGPKFL